MSIYKAELQEKNELFQEYISSRIDQESQQAEKLVINIFKIIVPLLALIPIVYSIVDYFHGSRFKIGYFLLLVYLLAIIIYHHIISWYLSRKHLSYTMRFINVFIEITTISIVIVLMQRMFDSTIILSGPLVMVYMIMILMTGFRYSFRLSFFSGMIATFEFSILFFLFLPEVPADFRREFAVFGFPGVFQKCVYLMIVGVLSSILALYQKSMITKITVKSLEIVEISETFGQYVSHEIRDHILNLQGDDNALRQEGVVLFSNLMGFNSYIEKTSPKEVIKELNEYLTQMVLIITNHGGVVNKFVGDTIMAVYGFKDSSDFELSSVLSACLMYEKFLDFKLLWDRVGADFFMAMGIASGEFMTGVIGSDERKEFACIGDVVNIASRLEHYSLNYQKGFIISDEVFLQLDSCYHDVIEDIGYISLKGKANKVQAYLVDPIQFLKLYRRISS